MHLSPHFTLEEMIFSKYCLAYDIRNNPSQKDIIHLCRLCSCVLEPLRSHLNVPIHISSGYRCEELNERVGGVRNSNHTKGLACDFKVDSASHYLMAYTFLEKLDCVDELIKYPTFIHVSLKFKF